MELYNEFTIGIIFYYPTENEMKAVQKFSEIVNEYFVYDNSENFTPTYPYSISQYKKCNYISNNRNDGISKAFNHIADEAIKKKYKYLLLLDQDSIFDQENVIELFNGVRSYKKGDGGIFAPVSIPIKSIDEINKSNNIRSSQGYSEVEWKITSGSVIDLDIFKETNGFDENLFIDKVDYDYCKQVEQIGYKTIVVNSSILYQFLGEVKEGLFKASQHSPIRHYYLFRNRLYIIDKYSGGKQVDLKKNVFAFITSIRHFLKVLLFESDKINKVKHMQLGYKDYKRGKMGKAKNFIKK